MKKLLIIFATLTILTCFMLGTMTTVYADNSNTEVSQETPELPSTDEVIDNLGGNLTEDEKATIKANRVE